MINHSGWQVQGVTVDPILALLGIGAVLIAALIMLIVLVWRGSVVRSRAEAVQLDAARVFETEVAELKGRLQTMAELSITRQSELSRTINERLDRIGQNLGTNMEIFAEVERPAWVHVRYVDRDGQLVERRFEGRPAVIVQHEVDHLNGILFIDHLSKLRRDLLVRKFRKARRDDTVD